MKINALHYISTNAAAGIKVPVISIGGITLNDVPALLAAGLQGVAISGAIGAAENPAEATTLLVRRLSTVNPV